jgi:hypothetical protein
MNHLMSLSDHAYDDNHEAVSGPSGRDILVVSTTNGYVLRRAGTGDAIEGPFSVFGNAIDEARRVAAADGVNVWIDAVEEQQLVAAARDLHPPAAIERRRRRLVLPPCPACGSRASLQVIARTAFVLYVKCVACAFVWTEQKPGQAGFLTAKP